MKRKNGIILLVFILPFTSLSASGAIERDREYREELETVCATLFYDLETGRMTPEEGKGLLEELRIRYGRPFTDSEGILESLIDQVGEFRMSADQAVYEFTLLREGKLMAYRQERENPDMDSDLSDRGSSPGGSHSSPPSRNKAEPSSDRGSSGKGGG